MYQGVPHVIGHFDGAGLRYNLFVSFKIGMLFFVPMSLACSVLAACAFAASACAADVAIGSGIRLDSPVASMKDLRDQNVVKQEFDYSCGAAALATILRYGYGEQVTERELLVQMFGLLSEEEKQVSRKEGFSLLDLQRVAQARDYKAEGFRLAPQYLNKLGGSVIVFIEPRGYKHFAVLRGVKGDRVYLADPSRGNIRMPVHAFLESWLQDDGKGIIFVVEPKTALPTQRMALALSADGLPQPEIMTVRQMLAVGNPFVQLRELAR